MDNLAYVSSTVLRSVSCRQTGPKNQGLRGTAQGTLSSSAGLVNCFSGSHNLLKQRRRFLVPLPPWREAAHYGSPRSCLPQDNEMQNEKHRAPPRLSNHY